MTSLTTPAKRVKLSPLCLLRHWVVREPERRARLLLRFADTEADGARDLVRAAEATPDPLLRRLYLRHASDEQRHAELFRQRGIALTRALPQRARLGLDVGSFVPGERGLDDLRIENESDGTLLAFLAISETEAAKDLSAIHDLLDDDRPTQAMLEEILSDEAFHMSYTRAQLVRVSPENHRQLLWRARAKRVWKAYLRLATALAGVFGTLVLTVLYFTVVPPFAVLAKRAERREHVGWTPLSPERNRSLESQY